MKGRKSENEKKIELFVDWLATPEEERLIKTQKEFATSIGVDEHTLGRWKAQLAETDSGDEVAQFRKQVYKQAMRAGATAKHMELYARLKGLMDKPETGEPHERTADELTRFHLELVKIAEGQLEEWKFETMREVYSVRARPYDKGELEDIFRWAVEKGIISDFKEVPSVFLAYHIPSKCLKEIPFAENKEEAKKRVYELNMEARKDKLSDTTVFPEEK